MIKVGDREVSPHVFRDEYKAAYHVALYDWLLTGRGEEPEIVAFGPHDWPARPVDPAQPSRPAAFLAWAAEMFGPVAKVRGERLMRFVEEAIELAHADNMELETLHAIIRRVYSRAPGLIEKEIGQAQACLETYAENSGYSSSDLAEKEWQRVQGIPREEWSRRHSAKQALGIAPPSTPSAAPYVDPDLDRAGNRQYWADRAAREAEVLGDPAVGVSVTSPQDRTR
jgi:hypothetical protein